MCVVFPMRSMILSRYRLETYHLSCIRSRCISSIALQIFRILLANPPTRLLLGMPYLLGSGEALAGCARTWLGIAVIPAIVATLPIVLARNFRRSDITLSPFSISDDFKAIDEDLETETSWFRILPELPSLSCEKACVLNEHNIRRSKVFENR